MSETTLADQLARFEALPTDTPHGDLVAFYEREVFPLARVEAQAHAIAPVDLLFVTAGAQHYSIALSLEASPAKQVVLLCTDVSQANAVRAAQLVLDPSAVPLYARVDLADPLSVYSAILDAFRRFGSPSRVAVDITSGTKAMTAAASSSAVVLGATQRYIESQPLKQRGFFGREKVHTLDHPLVRMGDLQRVEAERHFDHLALDRAEALFRELHRLGAPRYLYAERAELAVAYRHCDALRFSDAADAIERALPRVRNAIDKTDPLTRESERLARQVTALRTLARGDDTPALLRFFMAYARRREAQQLYDAAALVHYRTIELAIQRRLRDTWGLDPDKAMAASWLDAATKAGFADLGAFCDRYAKDNPKKDKLDPDAMPPYATLMLGWLTLRVFNDPLTSAVKADKLEGETVARNKSIFAHGTQPLTPEAYAKFAQTAAAIRTRFADLSGFALPTPDDDYDFVRFGA